MIVTNTFKKDKKIQEYEMPSHAELAAKLLRDAASFFRTVGEQNEPLRDQMTENADVFEQVAALVEQDPNGELVGAEDQQQGSQN